jgi:hypothetical protein
LHSKSTITKQLATRVERLLNSDSEEKLKIINAEITNFDMHIDEFTDFAKKDESTMNNVEFWFHKAIARIKS